MTSAEHSVADLPRAPALDGRRGWMEETMSEYRIVNHDADQIIVYEDGRFLATVKTHDTAKRIVAALAASPRPQEPAGDRSVGEERR